MGCLCGVVHTKWVCLFVRASDPYKQKEFIPRRKSNVRRGLKNTKYIWIYVFKYCANSAILFFYYAFRLYTRMYWINIFKAANFRLIDMFSILLCGEYVPMSVSRIQDRDIFSMWRRYLHRWCKGLTLCWMRLLWKCMLYSLGCVWIWIYYILNQNICYVFKADNNSDTWLFFNILEVSKSFWKWPAKPGNLWEIPEASNTPNHYTMVLWADKDIP